MRATVTIDADAERLLKKTMRERGQSFGQLINDSLRQTLAGTKSAGRVAYQPIAFSMGPVLADLTKATGLAAELEDAELVKRIRPREAAP